MLLCWLFLLEVLLALIIQSIFSLGLIAQYIQEDQAKLIFHTQLFLWLYHVFWKYWKPKVKWVRQVNCQLPLFRQELLGFQIREMSFHFEQVDLYTSVFIEIVEDPKKKKKNLYYRFWACHMLVGLKENEVEQ